MTTRSEKNRYLSVRWKKGASAMRGYAMVRMMMMMMMMMMMATMALTNEMISSHQRREADT